MLNSRGPNTDPCGTPHGSSAHVLNVVERSRENLE